MYLHRGAPTHRDHLLLCALKLLAEKIAPLTPLDVYIFLEQDVSQGSPWAAALLFFLLRCLCPLF